MGKNLTYVFIFQAIMLIFSGCANENPARIYRKFESSFETVDDFKGFYIEQQNHKNSSNHILSEENVLTGQFAHKAWIYAPNSPSTLAENNNHRGYPTVQFHKTSEGVFKCPCYITLMVWLDMELKSRTGENEWFSFATFTSDTNNTWPRTFLVNLSYDGFAHLMHVPNQGESVYDFQTTTLPFPQKEWVELKVYLDTDPETGYMKVWQNNMLVSQAKIKGGNGTLAQAHFGLYAPPSVESGTVYNENLLIREVEGE